MFERAERLLFGERPRGRFPERVRQAVEEQQANSEVLIAWMQFIVVLVFGALYVAAPKAFSEDVSFAPVPWVLGGFIGFSIIRLLLIRRGFQPRWFLALAVIADTALLMVLIWSFHLQYEQPAAFYLKAPTLLYVFIFIALRSLRFDPWFVLLAGACAAFGWLALLGYSVWSDEGGDMITRDFVEYVQANKILIGAEFDKVISITVTTLILAVSIVRARRLMIRSVTEQAAVRDLSRFFAPEVAQAITASDKRIQPGTGEARTAGVLMCDIGGFTGMAAAMGPNDLIALLTEYESRLVPVIRRNGGSVDKFLGDGIMATFGAVLPTETFAADAMRAVEDLMEAAATWRREREAAGLAPVDVRFAVAVGPVVFGAVGDVSRLEYTVIGEPVNIAAKLEKHAKVETCGALTTVAALKLGEAQGYRPRVSLDHRQARPVDGLEKPVDIVAFCSAS